MPTDQGYPDQLYAMLHPGRPGLRLVKLGCGGETTATMIHGGICSYPGGSQLAAAVAFLRAHPGRVSLVTIDIGANDANGCFFRLSLSRVAGCIGSAVPHIGGNLTTIMRALRAAGGRQLRIIGMSYYVPELAVWRDGVAGQADRAAERAAGRRPQRAADQQLRCFRRPRGGRVRRVQQRGFHQPGDRVGPGHGAAQRRGDLLVDLGLHAAAARPERARERGRATG